MKRTMGEYNFAGQYQQIAAVSIGDGERDSAVPSRLDAALLKQTHERYAMVRP
jgi:hypothetical protein